VAYRYDVSYPFLDIAQRYDVSYADVLLHAEWMESWLKQNYPDITKEMEARALRLPEEAKDEIIGLVRLPVHERGGRTDICDECPAQARSSDVVVCNGRVKMTGELTGYLIPDNCLARQRGYVVTP
jgi:hypothetical protein